jgi:uncharacterized protein
MAPTSSTEPALTPDDRHTLHRLAKQAIASGVNQGAPLTVDIQQFSPALRTPRATFVTLTLNGRLRGCVGTLEAMRPLADDVARNAYAAAFSDHRFDPVSAQELPHLEIHISLLSPPQPMQVQSEADLLRQLRPGIDGLILEEGRRRGTFLPSVWEGISDPREFVDHLRIKAGLPAGYWSDTLRVSRYTTESV